MLEPYRNGSHAPTERSEPSCCDKALTRQPKNRCTPPCLPTGNVTALKAVENRGANCGPFTMSPLVNLFTRSRCARLKENVITMDWRSRAACLDKDPELFFPVGNTGPALLQIEEAKSVCRRCPVQDTCLQWAIESGQDAGVWGGLSEDERRALKRRAARARRAS